MDSYTCHYDCDRPPLVLSGNPDILGIGVSLAYSITAGIAVATVLSYYISIYRPYPEDRPTNARDDKCTKKIETNRIDAFVLSWKRPKQDNSSNTRKRKLGRLKKWQEASQTVS
jgi:hypothetical protein